jgi:hypothetical protein
MGFVLWLILPVLATLVVVIVIAAIPVRALYKVLGKIQY